MHIVLSPLVEEKLKRIKKRDKKLFSKINKQLLLFANNPKHPSLRIHKLTGKNEPVWSISITMSIRMLYKIIGEDYYLMDIGTHEEVYKRKN